MFIKSLRLEMQLVYRFQCQDRCSPMAFHFTKCNRAQTSYLGSNGWKGKANWCTFLGAGKIWMPIARWQGNTRSPTVKVCTNKAILCWAHLLLTNSQLTSRFRCSQKLQSFHCHLYFNTPLKFFACQIFIGRSATQSHTMLGCGAPHRFKQFLHKCWEVLKSMPCNASEILLHKRTPRGGKTGGRILSLPPWSGLQDASAWPGLKKQLKFGITMERTLHWDCSQRCHPVQDLKAFVHCVCNVNYA